MNNKKSESKHTTSWSDVASWYDQYVGQDGSPFHQEVILPGVEKLLRIPKDPITPFTLLDLACGQGVLQRYLQHPHVHHVGMDISESLISLAKKRSLDARHRYVHGDATMLINHDGSLNYGFQDATFDAVTILLAIQNISPLSALWKGIKRLLKPDGKCIIVMMHPSFRIPKASSWQWNDKEKRQERIVWSYLSSHEIPITSNPGNALESTTTIHFHRPLQAYVNTLGNAGLLIDHLEEWVSHVAEQTGVKSDALLHAKKEFPMFLALVARNVAPR
jgi:ubiquinone/menaquinone biosynthesis C-methylase UbiE